jgi:hypothetical protein
VEDWESQQSNTNSQNYVSQMITTFLERISQALTEKEWNHEHIIDVFQGQRTQE